VLLDKQGKRSVAAFPPFIKRPIQYGPKVKACSVYMSQFQLVPNARVIDYFTEHMGLSISAGSVFHFHFHQEAYQALEDFETISFSLGVLSQEDLIFLIGPDRPRRSEDPQGSLSVVLGVFSEDR
jgi:hypothetical protein